jgi:predicted metal-dependent peptidase
MEATTVQKAIFSLLKTEPFYAHFFLGSKVVYSEKDVPTAGVAMIQSIPTFFFNPTFMASLTTPQTEGVIKHEVLHLVLRHTDSSLYKLIKAKYPNVNNIHELANIAQDCMINQHINELPEKGVTLESLSEQVGKALKPFQTSEYYLKEIMESPNKQTVAFNCKNFDEHLQDDGETPEALSKAAIDKITKQAISKSAGNIPQNLLQHISLAKEPTLSWKTLLKNFVARNNIPEKKNTYKKLNRRFALPVPGRTKKKSFTLGVCVDSSGSVSNTQYEAFMGEIQGIAKIVTKLYVIDADCTVQNVTLVKNKKNNATRHGSGGTAYQPAITKAVELGCDAIAYFGDGDSADVPKKPNVPFLWVLVGDSPAPADFGKVIRLEESKRN